MEAAMSTGVTVVNYKRKSMGSVIVFVSMVASIFCSYVSVSRAGGWLAPYSVDGPASISYSFVSARNTGSSAQTVTIDFVDGKGKTTASASSTVAPGSTWVLKPVSAPSSKFVGKLKVSSSGGDSSITPWGAVVVQKPDGGLTGFPMTWASSGGSSYQSEKARPVTVYTLLSMSFKEKYPKRLSTSCPACAAAVSRANKALNDYLDLRNKWNVKALKHAIKTLKIFRDMSHKEWENAIFEDKFISLEARLQVTEEELETEISVLASFQKEGNAEMVSYMAPIVRKLKEKVSLLRPKLDKLYRERDRKLDALGKEEGKWIKKFNKNVEILRRIWKAKIRMESSRMLALKCIDHCKNSGKPGQKITHAGDSSRTITVSSGHRIQKAIDQAGDGSVIVVSPGYYTGNLKIHGKSITLRSRNPADKRTRARTVIKGRGKGSVITASHADNVTISGFTIKGGQAKNGGGIHVDHGAATITDNVITGNRASENGGGISIAFSDRTKIAGNIIEKNKAGADGGGIFQTDSIDVDVSNNHISNNNAARDGGGFKNTSKTRPLPKGHDWADVDHNVIKDNKAGRNGGGAMLSVSALAVSDNDFIANSAAYKFAKITNTSPSANTITIDFKGCGGGAAVASSSSSVAPGATWILSSASGSAREGSWTVNIAGNHFTGNKAKSGGALCIDKKIKPPVDKLDLTGNTFSGNNPDDVVNVAFSTDGGAKWDAGMDKCSEIWELSDFIKMEEKYLASIKKILSGKDTSSREKYLDYGITLVDKGFTSIGDPIRLDLEEKINPKNVDKFIQRAEKKLRDIIKKTKKKIKQDKEKRKELQRLCRKNKKAGRKAATNKPEVTLPGGGTLLKFKRKFEDMDVDGKSAEPVSEYDSGPDVGSFMFRSSANGGEGECIPAASDVTNSVIRPMPKSEKTVNKAKSAVSDFAKGAVGSLFGVGGSKLGGMFGRGGGQDGARTVKRPVVPFYALSNGETGVEVGGWVYKPRSKKKKPEIRIAQRIKDSPDKGAPHMMLLQNRDGRILRPIGYMIFELWRHWKLTITITRDTWVNGEHTSHTVTRESTQWNELAERYRKIMEAPGIWEQFGLSPFGKLRGVIARFPLPEHFNPAQWTLVKHDTAKAMLNGEEVIKTVPFIAGIGQGKKNRLTFKQSPDGKTAYQRAHGCRTPGEVMADLMARYEQGNSVANESDKSLKKKKKPGQYKLKQTKMDAAHWARILILQPPPVDAWLKGYHKLSQRLQQESAVAMANIIFLIATGSDVWMPKQWFEKYANLDAQVRNLAISAANRWKHGMNEKQMEAVARSYAKLSPGLQQLFKREFTMTLAMNLFFDLRQPTPVVLKPTGINGSVKK